MKRDKHYILLIIGIFLGSLAVLSDCLFQGKFKADLKTIDRLSKARSSRAYASTFKLALKKIMVY